MRIECIRPETEGDRAAVRAVNEAAFETRAEADLVEALHSKDMPLISLVAEADGKVVGHILFSPVSLTEHAHLKVMGLAPMAVAPDYQRKGIGSALVRQGLTRCKDLGCCAVVVVGHPEFYPRFGFGPADRYALRCEYDVPADVFMVAELEAGALSGVSGLVRYDDAFASV
jgi:putative acetyltransferase